MKKSPARQRNEEPHQSFERSQSPKRYISTVRISQQNKDSPLKDMRYEFKETERHIDRSKSSERMESILKVRKGAIQAKFTGPYEPPI